MKVFIYFLLKNLLIIRLLFEVFELYDVYLLMNNLMVVTEGKPIPTELRNEDAALRQEIDLEDERTAGMFVSENCV